MTVDATRHAMSFGAYVLLLLRVVVTSTLALALPIGIALLFVGETTADIDLDVSIGALDGLSLIVAAPLLVSVVFVILSPLSYWIFRIVSRRTPRVRRGESEPRE